MLSKLQKNSQISIIIKLNDNYYFNPCCKNKFSFEVQLQLGVGSKKDQKLDNRAVGQRKLEL
jgi:transcription initiation factor IIE alpha subunit